MPVASKRRSIFEVTHPRQVWLVTLAHGVNEFYSVALPPVIPLLVTDLSISYGQAGGLLTAYYLMYTLFQLPAGRLADRVGQTRILSLGMVGLSGGILIASMSQDYTTLLLAQVMAGIAGSTYHPAGMSLISDFETDATEGKAMGIHGFGGLVGTAAAPIIIGGLAVIYDWRVAVGTSAVVGVLSAALFTRFFTEPTAHGVSNSAATRISRTTSTMRETAPRESVILRIRRALNVPISWWFAGLCLVQFLLAFESSAVRTFAPSYLFERTGESTGLANAIYFAMIVGGGASNLGGGYLADRVDRRWLGFGGLSLSGAGLAIAPLIPASAPLLIAWFFLIGFVLFAASPAKNALAASYSQREFSGSLFGMMMTVGAVGSASGPFLVGVLAERFDITVAFPMIAVIGIFGGIAFVLLFRA